MNKDIEYGFGDFLKDFNETMKQSILGSEDKTTPPGERPKAPPMPEPKERRSTDLDPAKKFQCEMAERILIGVVYKDDNINHHTDLSIEISETIYNYFFK